MSEDKVPYICTNEDGKTVFDRYWLKDNDYNYIYKTEEEFKKIIQESQQCDIVCLSMEDLSAIKSLKFKKDSVVDLSGAEDLCKNIDISQCASVDLSGRKLSQIKPQKMQENSTFKYTNYLPGGMGVFIKEPFCDNIDLSRCASITINNADLSNVKNLSFRKNAQVDLSGCANLPKNMDFSQCDSVTLSGCDLTNFDTLKLKPNTKLDLSRCKNIPKDLDFSQLSEVDLSGLDLSQFDNIKFKEGAVVNLSGCTNIPQTLDLSQCQTVDLSNCDLTDVNLSFRENSTLNLSRCTNLPQTLDLSNCQNVDLRYVDFNPLLLGTTDLKFKDGASVNLKRCQNLPENINFEACAELNLEECDLASNFIGNNRDIQFRENSKVNLRNCENLPPNLDFSQCDTINLSQCDLSNRSNLKFKDQSKVKLSSCDIPDNLDLSNCQEVWINAGKTNSIKLGDAHVVIGGIGVRSLDVSSLKDFTTETCYDKDFGQNTITFLSLTEITFKDKQQYQEYLSNENNLPIPENCKIVFANENENKKEKLHQELKEQTGELPQNPKENSQTRRIDSALPKHDNEPTKNTATTNQQTVTLQDNTR